MEIAQQGKRGALFSFKAGSIALNPSKKISKAIAVVTTYPVIIAGWEIEREIAEHQQLFSGAGEYEKEGIVLWGIGSETERQGQVIQTTSWSISAEDLRILTLGDIATVKELTHIATEVGEVDIVVLCAPADKEKRPGVTEYISAVAKLQAKKLILIGDDTKMKTALAKEVGTHESVSGKYTVKKKGLETASLSAIIL